MEETKRRFDKSTLKKRVVPILLIFALLIGSAFAFLTARDSLTNNFTLGLLGIKVTETDWPFDPSSDERVTIYPGDIVAKNPAVLNTFEAKNAQGTTIQASVDAWVYLAVEVPVTYASYIDETGNAIIDPGLHSMYKFGSLDEDGNFVEGVNDADWTLIGTDESKAKEHGTITYYYAYKDIVAPDDTTSELFTHVKFNNYSSTFIDEDAAMIEILNHIHADIASGKTQEFTDFDGEGNTTYTLPDPDFENADLSGFTYTYANGEPNTNRQKIAWYFSQLEAAGILEPGTSYEDAYEYVISGGALNAGHDNLIFRWRYKSSCESHASPWNDINNMIGGSEYTYKYVNAGSQNDINISGYAIQSDVSDSALNAWNTLAAQGLTANTAPSYNG